MAAKQQHNCNHNTQLQEYSRYLPHRNIHLSATYRSANPAKQTTMQFIILLILNVIKLAIETRQAQRDRLYQEAINPVTGTGGDGYVLYGDKTATSVPSPFDRINVRRLFNMLKTNIGRSSKYRLFELNNAFTRSSFRTETAQYLQGIKALGGIYEYRVVCDTRTSSVYPE